MAKGKLAAADRDALLGRVDFAVGLDALHDVDLVIEAVPEHLDLKQRIFAELDRVCKPEAILATNTSSLASPRSRSPPTGPTRSSACTSSTRRRS